MENSVNSKLRQYATFFLDDRLYGIDVTQVQEITKAMSMSGVPLSPLYVRGLINLRGQIATAISLKDLFTMNSEKQGDQMNVICNMEGTLIAFLVDQVGDVVEVEESSFEELPDTISGSIAQYLSGVHKLKEEILSVVDIKSILKKIND